MKLQKGFTLIEILVSITIIGILSIVASQTFISTTRSNNKTELLKEIKENGEYAQEIMSRLIREAESVESTCTAGGTESSTLDLVGRDGGTIRFSCITVAGVTRIASTSGVAAATYLTNDTVSLTAGCSGSPLMFTCYAQPSSPPRITIRFSLSQKGTPLDAVDLATKTFQTSITMRNTAQY